MEALYLLIPLSVLALAAALWLFLRMSGAGQFDDLDAPAHSILLDDDRPQQPECVAKRRGDQSPPCDP